MVKVYPCPNKLGMYTPEQECYVSKITILLEYLGGERGGLGLGV